MRINITLSGAWEEHLYLFLCLFVCVQYVLPCTMLREITACTVKVMQSPESPRRALIHTPGRTAEVKQASSSCGCVKAQFCQLQQHCCHRSVITSQQSLTHSNHAYSAPPKHIKSSSVLVTLTLRNLNRSTMDKIPFISLKNKHNKLNIFLNETILNNS